MSGVEPDHHIVNIMSSAIVLLILHPLEHLNAMFKRTPLGYLLRQRKGKITLASIQFKLYPLCPIAYPNKKGEIFPGEATDPAIQEAFYVVTAVELQKPLNHLRNGPVLLKPVGLDPQPVAFGNVGFSVSGDISGDLVLAVVVVD